VREGSTGDVDGTQAVDVDELTHLVVGLIVERFHRQQPGRVDDEVDATGFGRDLIER
jgi:hypothetical protein